MKFRDGYRITAISTDDQSPFVKVYIALGQNSTLNIQLERKEVTDALASLIDKALFEKEEESISVYK